MSKKINVTVWNEYIHEIEMKEAAAVYPNGMHNAIGDSLKKNSSLSVRTATLKEPEHGLTDEVLNSTDVLIWWGHCAHDQVCDEIVQKVYDRVQAGMGLIVLHSGHASKIFKKLLGTNTEKLKWREDGKFERLWLIDPTHPIAKGINEYIELPQTEMYGEWFEIPKPDDIVFISWFEGGEVFRSGITYKRGLGKIFYFRPGHETYPIFHNEDIMKVIENAVLWAVPAEGVNIVTGHYEGVNK